MPVTGRCGAGAPFRPVRAGGPQEQEALQQQLPQQAPEPLGQPQVQPGQSQQQASVVCSVFVVIVAS